MYGVVLHAHPVRGESHKQRNTAGEVATHSNFIHSVYVKELESEILERSELESEILERSELKSDSLPPTPQPWF